MSRRLTDDVLRNESRIKRTLRKVGLYERIRASFIADLYWTVSRSEVIANRRRELQFYRKLLSGFAANDLIFDIGANDGTKADVFLRLGARVVAVDPDASNVEIMKRRFMVARLNRLPLTIVQAAVSDVAGRSTMWVDH